MNQEYHLTRGELAKLLGVKDHTHVAKIHNRNKADFEGTFIVRKGQFLYDTEGIKKFALHTRNHNKARSLLEKIGFSTKEANKLIGLSDWFLRKQREILESSEGCKVELGNGTYMLIDEEDLERLRPYGWSDTGRYVEARIKVNGTSKRVNIHRFLMNPGDDEEVDHKNRNPYDNRKSNLRVCKRTTNRWNSGPKASNHLGYKGVRLLPSGNYSVIVATDGKQKQVGTFTDIVASANAYNYFAKKAQGDYAFLNEVPFMDYDEFMKYRSVRNGYK